MSVIQFLISGGIARTSGDLPKEEQNEINAVVKSFGEKVKHYGKELQIPASILSVQQCSYLFIGKDIANYHLVFANISGTTNIIYRDLTSHGRIVRLALVHQTRLDVGEVLWSFSYPHNFPASNLDDYIRTIAEQYVNTILQAQQNPEKAISEIKRVAKRQVVIVVPKQRYFYYTLDQHVNFFPLKEKLQHLIGMDRSSCHKIWGDWVYLGTHV